MIIRLLLVLQPDNYKECYKEYIQNNPLVHHRLHLHTIDKKQYVHNNLDHLSN